MLWLKTLFGKTGSPRSRHPLFSDKHPAAKEIAEVEAVAARTIEIKVAGSGTITSVNPNNAVQRGKPAELSQSRHFL